MFYIQFFKKLNLLGCLLRKLYRFKVYSSVTHHLYIALCVHHPKSGLLPSPVNPLLPPSPPFPSGNHRTVVCVYEVDFFWGGVVVVVVVVVLWGFFA